MILSFNHHGWSIDNYHVVEMLVPDLIYECLLQRRRSSLKQLFQFPVFERMWLRQRYPYLPPAWRRPQGASFHTIISEHCPVDDRICHRKSVYRYQLIYDGDDLVYVMAFADDVLHYEYQVKGNQVHGLFLIYDPWKELLACFIGVEGKREGAHYSFYPCGTVSTISHSLNNQIHGPWTDYREDGTVKHVRRYEKGMLVESTPITDL